MEAEIGYAIGSFLAVLTDVRVLAIALIAVAIFAKPYVSVPIGALLGATILFMSQMKMAPILSIPGPGLGKFVLNLVNAGLVTGIFALLRRLIFKRKAGGEA